MLEQYFLQVLENLSPLSSWKKKSWDLFSSLGGLDFKKESFQYVKNSGFSFLQPAQKTSLKAKSEIEGYKIVFVDGYLDLDQSVLPEDIICMSLESAMKPYGAFLQNRFQKSLKEETDPLALLNGAFSTNGAFIFVPSLVDVDKPIFVEYFVTQNSMVMPRIILHVGKNSSVKLKTKIHAQVNCWMLNGYLDASLEEGSFLELKQELTKSDSAHVFQTVRATVKKDAKCYGFFFSEGASIARLSLKAQILEENAEVRLLGVSRLNQNKQNHVHAKVEHLAPNSTSYQHFKALVEDDARSSFEGKIYVDSTALKTQSYQLCNHLLLSDRAFAFAKPNLEIFADDVKASHGATVSQIDEESLFYLKSRGLAQSEARQLLTQSFIQELQQCLP